MSNVNLAIGGRSVTVSCADGEESHVEMLGRMIDDRVRRIGSAQGEMRTYLFAALMLADELHEAHNTTAPPSAAPAPEPQAAPVINDLAMVRLVERVSQLSKRVEKVRQALEQAPTSA